MSDAFRIVGIPGIAVSYIGAQLHGRAKEQVSAAVWAALNRQKYVDGTEARVRVEERAETYFVEAMAREPNGPPLRLIDLEIPHEGVNDDELREFLRAHGLSDASPPGAIRFGVDVRPRVGRNDPCPCGSGKKFKKCCIDKASAVTRAVTQPAPVDSVLFETPCTKCGGAREPISCAEACSTEEGRKAHAEFEEQIGEAHEHLRCLNCGAIGYLFDPDGGTLGALDE